MMPGALNGSDLGSSYMKDVLFGYEVGDFGGVYEICFVFGRGLPFGGLAGCEQVFCGVEPEFGDAVVGGRVFVARDVYAAALD